VVSSSPGQTVASGRVALTDASDSSLQIQGSIGTQGQFKLPYVPPGTYTLQISGASTAVANNGFNRRGGNSTAGVSFQPFSQTLIVGETDVSGVAATLIPVAAP
jgi:septal ring-binding cell division protein DamX